VPDSGPELRTERLLLRRWRETDREPFAALNADPEVMEHFPGPMAREESDTFVDRIETHFAEHGFGLWAVEVVSTGSFAGFVGLAVPRFQAHFTPAVEVGWRLARQRWGNGYATEAARAALAFGFEEKRVVHGSAERAIQAGDGWARDEAGPRGRLRPSLLSGRAQAPPARALQAQPGLVSSGARPDSSPTVPRLSSSMRTSCHPARRAIATSSSGVR
jgi:RimJ/RimL family protein N-acetyltransferase